MIFFHAIADTLSYSQYVEFTQKTGVNAPAVTIAGQTTTKMNRQKIGQLLATLQNTPNIAILYANILTHEVIHNGMLGHSDDSAAAKSTFGSNSASSQSLMTLTREQAEEIADELEAEIEEQVEEEIEEES